MPRTRSSVRRSRSRAASTMPAASARSRSRSVGLHQGRPLLFEEVGGQPQRVVAHRARRPRHHPGGRPDAARELLQCGRGHRVRLQGPGRRDGRRPGCGAPSTRRPARRAPGPGPWRRPRRRARRSRRRRRAGSRPVTPVTPAASSDRPRPVSAARAPSSTARLPRRAQREGDPQLAGREPALAGPEHRADARPRRPGRPPALRDGRRRRSPSRTPDQVAIFAAASFEAMPPLPMALPGPAGQPLELLVDLDHLFDQRRLAHRGAGRP